MEAPRMQAAAVLSGCWRWTNVALRCSRTKFRAVFTYFLTG